MKMREDRFFLYLLVGHLLVCLLLYSPVKKKKLDVSWELYLFALFVPIWGALMLWLTDYYAQRGKIGSRELDLQRFTSRTRILARPFVEEELADKRLMPLEEALILENPAIRRHLMKELVQENPKKYIPILQRVRLSEDTEVSHYASTAIMQIQTDFEVALHRLEQTLRKERTEENLRAYIEQLKEYIASDLMPSNAQMAQRGKLKVALQDYLEDYPDNRGMYLAAIDNALELDQLATAREWIEEVERRWTTDEALFLLKLKLHYKERNNQALKAEITHAKETNLYLTPETRAKIAFWSE